MKEFKLPQQFLLGTATASLQIEGGDQNNNWYRWSELKKIKDGSSSIRADDHYNRVNEDIALMKELNHQTYRMGIEWSRIEPSEGRFDEKAITHYRNEIEQLIKSGIRPLVTVYHFSHPLWFEDKGGWENPQSVETFCRYTAYLAEKLGDLVTDWITINEPNVYAFKCYLEGSWPPGKSNIKALFSCLRNMVLGHIRGYKIIHETRKKFGYKEETLVGVANHIRVMDPKRNNLLDRFSASAIDYLFHHTTIAGMTTGKMVFPLGHNNYPLGKGKYYDFFGINYYSRDILSFVFDPGKLFAKIEVKEGVPLNNLGWEIYPEGLYRICKKYYEKYKAPIFITENGICDADDSLRGDYLADHLEVVARLIEQGVPVERYYHWTLMDNFEWIEGESARFGLVENDFQTQKRTIRKSGWLFADIAKAKGLTKELIKKYQIR